ncbi:hypothetical protein GYA19_03055 [Candidatus Beckwithbacteria bacterium]|nr:hypothetical protein [Candidatus Beckwithbacteria bacterium]
MENGPLGTQKEAFENAKSLATQARNAYKEILSSFKEILALIKTLEK